MDGISNKVTIATGSSVEAKTVKPEHTIYIYGLYVPSIALPDLNRRIQIDIYAVFLSDGCSLTLEFRNNTISNLITTIAATIIGPTVPQGPTGATGPQGITGPQGPTGATGPLPAYYYAESLGESSSTSAYPTYENKVTLTCTPVAGTYILEWNFASDMTAGGGDTWVKIHDGTTIYSESRINCAVSYANSGWEARSGFIKLTLTATEKNFYIDFCRQTAGTAWNKNAKILLRRIA
jgi:hypothetical protein